MGDADRIVAVAARVVPVNDTTRPHLLTLYLYYAEIEAARGEPQASRAALGRAYELGRREHPELGYRLGMAYLTGNPPELERGAALVRAFFAERCDSAAKEYLVDCASAGALLRERVK